MLGIKAFVQESVQALPPSQLRLLAGTLRIDLRGCEDRGDIERVLTGLVCLDQDTSLGVFLAWLRSADLQQRSGILASKKQSFNNTFLPAIRTNNQQVEGTERVKDHHLDDEIKQQLSELEVLEAAFKKAERQVHTGSPSFEKLKQFLMELTILRAKEQSARAFLVRRPSLSADRPAPTLERYANALKKHVSDLMETQNKRGFVMYNWPFFSRDVNLLTVIGLPVDSVINLEVIQSPPTALSSVAAPSSTPATVTTPSTPASIKPKTPVATAKTTSSSSSNSRAKAPVASSTARGKAAPSKPAAASKSPAKPASRAAAPSTAGKPRAARTTATATSSSKPKTPAVPSAPVKPGTSTSQLKSEAAKVIKQAPTAASALQGLGGIVQSVGPATFPAERVNAILQVLEQQKRRKVAPIVRWDEATRRTNEMLAMWAEEVHMLVVLEQESRKPQKAPLAPAVNPSKPTTSSPKRSTTAAKGPTRG
ncbi:hypothetical protein AM588_10010209 [Phytophthora nicotianae]|uniref:Uncharacterized protein n=1 Tax=Phytophthora nicotianae TaxID=4792 RepID=A0A0W8DF21_PHYNI|nr:hypothetical protein AM588_10010209 [Phytophthora nicotianae]